MWVLSNSIVITGPIQKSSRMHLIAVSPLMGIALKGEFSFDVEPTNT